MSNKPEEKLVPVKWSKESDEELKRLIEESKATVNWTEVAKWEAKGRPYEIDEEILLFYKDELTNLGSNGTGSCDINGSRKQILGDASYTSSRKRSYLSGKGCDYKPSTKKSTTTESYPRQYRNKVVGSHQISSSIAKRKRND
ncbi:unnamed protein product [Rhizophagus irregularis]|nr:unnamed protein product [Rhizophagus irregularis]